MRTNFLMNNGEVFSGEKVDELKQRIVNMFADERLSSSEAILVLDRARETIGDFAIVQHTDLKRGAIKNREGGVGK